MADLSDIIIVEDDMDFYDMFEPFFGKEGDCRHSRVINDKNGDGFTVVDFMDKLDLVEIVAECDELEKWLENIWMLTAMTEDKRKKRMQRITTWGLGAILVWVWFELLVLIGEDRGLVG